MTQSSPASSTAPARADMTALPPRGVLRPLSVAPMLDRTDRHFRWLMRQITRHTLLYTEMVTTGAILYGDRPQHLDFSTLERPLALQLGGDDPKALAACARIGTDWGYDEINLNVGCPSDRVQSGRFGASLMAHPNRVADAVAAMRAATNLPVTVKHRIGIDHQDTYSDMLHFVDVVSTASPDRLTVHARKAWLKGLSPKQNRNVPPLRYEDVHRLKTERPALQIEINGGIHTLDEAHAQLDSVDAVMIGRAAYDNPWSFARADPEFFDAEAPTTDLRQVVLAAIPYLEGMIAAGERPHHLTRHMLSFFGGQPGSRRWRRSLSENAPRPNATAALLTDALDAMDRQPRSF